MTDRERPLLPVAIGRNRPIAAGCDRQQWPNLTRPLRRQQCRHIFEIGIRIMPIHACLDMQANFAKMLVGFLILERFDNLAQREMTINNRAHAIRIDGSNHV